MQFDIQEFDPLKKEIFDLVQNVKTTVASSTGAVGLELLKENKTLLQKKRTSTVEFMEGKREASNAYSRGVIKLQNELVAMIKEAEQPLDEKIEEIKKAERREKNKALLPERIEKLNSINYLVDEEWLLDLDEKQFATFYVRQKELYLEEKEKLIKEAEQEKENQRLAEEAEKQRQADIKKAAEEAAAKAKKDAEEAAEKAIAEAKKKADKEKQDLIDEQNRKDAQRILDEQRKKEDKEAEEKRKAEELERQKKNKKYIKFLKDNGCEMAQLLNNALDIECFVSRNGNQFILYKKIAETKI